MLQFSVPLNNGSTGKKRADNSLLDWCRCFQKCHFVTMNWILDWKQPQHFWVHSMKKSDMIRPDMLWDVWRKKPVCVRFSLDRPSGLQEIEVPRIARQTGHDGGKFVNPTYWLLGCFYPPGNIPGTHFCLYLSWPQGHNVARRFKSNSIDLNGIRTHNLLACSTVPQLTVPPHTPSQYA